MGPGQFGDRESPAASAPSMLRRVGSPRAWKTANWWRDSDSTIVLNDPVFAASFDRFIE
jgi:hypothetical protein